MEETLEEGVSGFLGLFQRLGEVEFDVILKGFGALGGIEPPLRSVGEDAPGEFAFTQTGNEFSLDFSYPS